MEENNEEKTTITENIADDTDFIKEQDEEIVAELADTLERPILNSKNSTKVRRPRSDAQVKAFAKARAALNQKRQLDREKKLAEKKPVGRPRNKKVEKVAKTIHFRLMFICVFYFSPNSQNLRPWVSHLNIFAKP